MRNGWGPRHETKALLRAAWVRLGRAGSSVGLPHSWEDPAEHYSNRTVGCCLVWHSDVVLVGIYGTTVLSRCSKYKLI